MIRETFFSRLLFRNTESLSPIIGSISMMTVNKSVLGVLNPVTLAKENYLSSQWASAELILAVTGGGQSTVG